MKHAASVHPEPGSNSPLSEKFMSLVHIPMNRSTSFYRFVRLIFSKSTGIYRLQLFYCQCSIYLLAQKNVTKKFLSSVPFSFTHRLLSDIFHPITSIFFVNLFFIFFLRVSLSVSKHPIGALKSILN